MGTSTLAALTSAGDIARRCGSEPRTRRSTNPTRSGSVAESDVARSDLQRAECQLNDVRKPAPNAIEYKPNLYMRESFRHAYRELTPLKWKRIGVARQPSVRIAR